MFRHQVGGRVRKYGLGPFPTISLADARQRAEAIRKQLLDGIDPREARRAEQEAAAVAQAKSISFDDATAAYIKSHQAGWKSDKHARAMAATLSTYASPVFGKLPVSAIDTGMVMRVLEPIWTSKTETAYPRAVAASKVFFHGPRCTAIAGREPGAVAQPSRPSAACAAQG